MGVEQELVVRRGLRRGCWAVAVALGCGPAAVVTDGGGAHGGGGQATTGTSSTDATHDADAGGASDGRTSAADASTGDGDTAAPGSDDDGGFLLPPDLGAAVRGCDPWAQDCPLGQKCAWYGTDGGWEAARCVPIVARPLPVGASCTVEGEPYGGFDDCERGAMCFAAAGEPSECVALCRGSEAAPWCADACSPCRRGSNGFALCMTMCDPLASDCPVDLGCRRSSEGFMCMPNADELAGPGGPCDLDDACAIGLRCVPAEQLPACAAAGCCSPYCDLDGADDCGAVLPDTHCVAEFETGQAPSCGSLPHLGACRFAAQ